MNIPVGTTRQVRPVSARDLEATIRWLRAEEPLCPPRQRTRLLIELATLSLDVERMILRNELHHRALPEEAHERRIEQYARRLGRLMPYWPEPVDARVPVPAAA